MATFSASGGYKALTDALDGQYELDREIGRGGMGVVYAAHDLRLDRLVAIKTLPSQMAGDPEVRERFLREARTAARLSHPNIVPIHRADEIDDVVFFVMGLVDGEPLAERLEAGPLSPAAAVPILRDVAAALGYAHAHGVVHRDVKTENVLLDSSTGRAMVTDFGIARVTEAAPLTATGQVLGTVYYLSPEQVTGEGVDARSDIYALGVVGYRMLAGEFPFDAPLASAVLVQHVTKQARPLASIAPGVPASLATIIDRCLAKDPSHRFQSCAELDAALAQAALDSAHARVARVPTPLVSRTEANVILGRAAELQDAPNPRVGDPIAPEPRDHVADARRSEGFRTQNLRDAAVEAGIEAKHMERALAERGLRPVPFPDRPDRRVTNVVHDLTRKGTFLRAQPLDLSYEMVLDGESPEDDYDLLIDVIRRATELEGVNGTAASVGRSLTWNGKSRRGRTLQISVVPRYGKTTIRVTESLRAITHINYGIIGGATATLGAVFWGSIVAKNGIEAAGIATVMWGFTTLLGFLTSRTSMDEYSQKRQQGLRDLLESLAAQARESIASKKK